MPGPPPETLPDSRACSLPDSAAETLGAVERGLRVKRQADVAILELAAHWADLHPESLLTREGDRCGYERAVRLGGEGTPAVCEFAPAELGVCLELHPLSARSLMADALDLRHRLPLVWAAVVELSLPDWVARKIASMTRALSCAQVTEVDARLDGVAASLPTSRLLALVEAMVLAAEEDADAARRLALKARFVRVNRASDTDTVTGTRGVYARLDAADAIRLDAEVDRLARILIGVLAARGETAGLDERRAMALGLLARPAAALRLIADTQTHSEPDTHTEPDAQPDIQPDIQPGPDAQTEPEPEAQVDAETEDAEPGDAEPGDAEPGDAETGDVDLVAVVRAIDPARLLPRTELVIHLTESDFTRDAQGVARFEGAGSQRGGPITLAHARHILGHSQVTIRPVIDLAHQLPADAYEFTGTLREAVFLRTPADCFPYAVNTGRGLDVDHTDPYQPGGPPGQTRADNAGPLTRHHHRIATHGRWRRTQLTPGVYLWCTPHGRYRLTDHTGTHTLDPRLGRDLFDGTPNEQHLAALAIEYRHDALAA